MRLGEGRLRRVFNGPPLATKYREASTSYDTQRRRRATAAEASNEGSTPQEPDPPQWVKLLIVTVVVLHFVAVFFLLPIAFSGALAQGTL